MFPGFYDSYYYSRADKKIIGDSEKFLLCIPN